MNEGTKLIHQLIYLYNLNTLFNNESRNKIDPFLQSEYNSIINQITWSIHQLIHLYNLSSKYIVSSQIKLIYQLNQGTKSIHQLINPPNMNTIYFENNNFEARY